MSAINPYSLVKARKPANKSLSFLDHVRRDMAEIARAKFRQAHAAGLPEELTDLLGDWAHAFEEKAP